MADDYLGTLKPVAQGKNGCLGTTWYVRMSRESWLDGVAGIGASAHVRSTDSPASIADKRLNLRASIMAHAQQLGLNADGLDAHVATLIEGIH